MLENSALWRFMQEGGWVMWGLLAFSVVALAVAIQRSWVLRRAGRPAAPLLEAVATALVRDRSLASARAACRDSSGAVASLVCAGLLRADEPPERLERILEATATAQLRRLERGLGVLASVAATAPLLGFLGTVTGMIASFAALSTYGIESPAMVAVGIKEALTTTAAGLVVAIPTQLLYQALRGRLLRIEGDLEAAANLLLDLLYRPEVRSGWSADAASRPGR